MMAKEKLNTYWGEVSTLHLPKIATIERNFISISFYSIIAIRFVDKNRYRSLISSSLDLFIANRLALATSFLLLFITSFLVSSSLLSQIPSYVPTNGLVGYWPFNGNANDESGNGNHGTVNGATLTSDRNGNANSAYGFQGANQHILIGENLNNGSEIGYPNTSWSLNLWFLNDGSNQLIFFSDYNSIAGNTNNGENDLILSLHNQFFDNSVFSSIRNFPFGDFGCDGIVPNIDSWKMYSCIYSQGTISIYINGTLLCSSSFNNALNYNENPVYRIGSSMWNGNYSQSYGQIDDIAIYNRALTQEEITALYNGTTNAPISGCTNTTACNYNATATQDDGSCTFPAQTYLNCAGTCINDADNDGTCDELETSTLPSYLPSNGLVGYWPFNGNANDESGNGNHGTVNGATLTSDRNGNANSAYSFDGVNDFIHINNLNSNSSGFTIQIWASIEDFYYDTTAQQSLIYLGTEAGANLSQTHSIDVTIDPINYTPPFLRSNLNYDYGFCGNQNSNNQWQCITVVLHGNSQQLEYFINGQSINTCSVNVNGIIIQPNDVNNFGAGWHFTNLIPQNFFKGQLDDIAIYNRALTQEEITALYNGTTTGGGGGNGGTAGTPAPSVPQGIPYQAMIRDNSGAALMNTPVTVRFSLHQDAIDGTVEYQETHNLTTNAFGLVNTHFGSGTATQNTFSNINWSNTTKFIQVEANTGSGFVEMGTQQMMSVPFALKANSANEANKVKNAGLPVYANNAAALAGGLVAGEMYRTAAGILMIVY